jgi:hypothetical protein
MTAIPHPRGYDPADGFEFRADDADPADRPVNWLWGPYLAFGTLAVLDGDPGAGETFLALDLAARLTAGKPMPDGSPCPDRPGGHHVMVVNAEDPVEKVLIPRFVAAGGDLTRLHFFGGLVRGQPSVRPAQFPRDFRRLADSLLEGPVSLLVLDSLSGLFPKQVSINSDQSIREHLQPLARLAGLTGGCVLFNRHLNKVGGRLRAIYRGTGSIGIAGTARSLLLAGRHPDDPNRRVLAHSKNNLGEEGPSLGYRLVTTGSVPTIAWDGPTNLTADDVCQADTISGGASREAEKWLRELLANGPVRSAIVEAAAHKAGICFATLKESKKRIRVESRRVVRDGETFWEWLPPRAPWDLDPIG